VLVSALSGAFASAVRPRLCTDAVVLGSLAEGPVPAKELWRRARVSKRAMKTMLGAATKRGLVVVEGDVARLAVRAPSFEPASCGPLSELVSRFELDHPDFPVIYGTADQSFTGGPGFDWRPVPREGAVDGLALSALLSQALVAFGIDYERAGVGPIMWTEQLRRGEPHGGMVRHGVTPDTDRGRVMLAAYEPTCSAIESVWRSRFGSRLIDDVVDAVGASSAPFPIVAWAGGEFAVVASDA
jgi:hypothetical protein